MKRELGVDETAYSERKGLLALEEAAFRKEGEKLSFSEVARFTTLFVAFFFFIPFLVLPRTEVFRLSPLSLGLFTTFLLVVTTLFGDLTGSLKRAAVILSFLFRILRGLKAGLLSITWAKAIASRVIEEAAPTDFPLCK